MYYMTNKTSMMTIISRSKVFQPFEVSAMIYTFIVIIHLMKRSI